MSRREHRPVKPRMLELAKSDYQPSKRELEEEFSFPSGISMEQLAQAILQPVDIKWRNKPKSRR